MNRETTMTIDEFATRTQTKKSTVISWVSKGLIPGAYGEYVPDSARMPYTRARAKTGESIIKSILKACNAKMGICAGIYGIAEEDFNTYISGLISGGYIASYEADGVQYYNITTAGISFLKNQQRITIKDIIPVVATLAGAAVPLMA